MKGIAGLGPVMQMAYVPVDFDAAIRFWTGVMGVGPFFLMEHIDVPALRYRDVPTQIDFSLALAYWGDIQIELVKQHCETPSIYSDWLREGRQGLHHVCQLVDDMDHARRICADAGATIVQELAITGGHALYVDSGGGPGTMVEILQPPPELLEFFAMAHAAARDWDGSMPLRRLG